MAEKKLVIAIDEDLKTELRIIALKQKKSVKSIVSELISDFVEENK